MKVLETTAPVAMDSALLNTGIYRPLWPTAAFKMPWASDWLQGPRLRHQSCPFISVCLPCSAGDTDPLRQIPLQGHTACHLPRFCL